MKFIHTADLHLGSPFEGLSAIPESYLERLHRGTNAAFLFLVKVALHEKVDFILIAGDFFDNHRPSVALQVMVYEQFEKLQRAGISVYLCLGNHDYLDLDKASVFFPENVYLFPNYPTTKSFLIKGEEIAITSFSYAQRWSKDIIQKFPKKSTAKWHLGMLHGALRETDLGSHYAPFSKEQLFEKKYDYWALGHIHKRTELSLAPPIIYPGSIQGKNRKETGPKGFYIVEEQGGKLIPHFHELKTVIWQTLDFVIEKNSNRAAFEKKIFEELTRLAADNSEAELILVTLRISFSNQDTVKLKKMVTSGFLIRRLRNLLHQVSNLYVEKVVVTLTAAPAVSLIDAGVLEKAKDAVFQKLSLAETADKLLDYPFIEKHLFQDGVKKEIETAAMLNLIEEADDHENITG
ncbi:metallophosphoesterase family protein [Liquorilactobacillus oeni]|uniref:DNA repair exonuclease n=1 Tax=Liquorilactobacillus oeni DSM 19972 TaxID=1423777 RepID=A0A0R1MFS9_9LACO|nr:DNA repair exonuclease [Liquorilactobacillus oeni]KRL04772.1 DNA repair exonuclease [Liquorilactobacillus oeni DSM 19972]